MNLSNLTAPLRQDYDFLQAQIETIQVRQQQILAGIQQIEDKVEAANLALSEAIAVVREYCPEQLGEYQQSVNELFETETVAQIEAFVEPEPAEEMVKVATVTIDGTAISVESLEDDTEPTEYGVEEIEEEAEHESTFAGFSEETIEEVADDGNSGRVYLTIKELERLNIHKLRSLATGVKVPTKSKKRYELIDAIKGLVTQDDLAELD